MTDEKRVQWPQEVDNFLKYLENIDNCSPLTIKAYRLDLHQIFSDPQNPVKISQKLSPQELLKISRAAQARWADLSPASRNRKAATIKSFLGYLFKENKIDQDISLQIHSPKIPKKIPNFLSVDEAIAVLKTIEVEKDSSTKILFLLLYGAGLRVSEACNLKTSQIDFSRQVLRINGKGNKERLVAFPSSITPTLKECLGAEYVWGDSALSTRKAYEMIRSVGVKSGLLKSIHPHALRHSFATHLLASGANLRTLQELLGHQSLQATEKYTHLGVDQLARTLEKHHPFGNKARIKS